MNARGPKGSRRSWRDTDQHLYDPTHEMTAAQSKIWVSLEGKFDTPELRKKVAAIRKGLGIAAEGVRKNPANLRHRDLAFAADELRQKLGLDFMWVLTIADFILYNEWRWHSSFGGLIEVVDEGKGLRPVSIRVSPYAKVSDIVDYIEKVYKTEIAPKQKKYQDESVWIGRFNKKNPKTKAIADFVYKNRAMSAKKLAQLVHEKFGENRDYTYISKIRRDEIVKRRK